MSDPCIVVFDDEVGIIETLKSLNDSIKTGLKFVSASTPAECKTILSDPEIKSSVRVLILDLAANKKEEDFGKFEIVGEIKNSYDTLRVPIFIHSGHLDLYEDFPHKGTIFKIGKGAASAKEMFDKIKLLQDSGFIDIFSPSGRIEEKIMQELHNAFTKQFLGGEIEAIIRSVNPEPVATYKDRIANIFERISYRALLNSLLSPTNMPEEGPKERQLNAVEFYYRRIDNRPLWTGDILSKKDNKEKILVLTPRCDIGKQSDSVLVCKVLDLDHKKLKDSISKLKEAINDNAEFTKGKYRFLPPNPLFQGGKVDYSSHYSISKQILKDEYDLVLTLADELVNDIAGKFAAYLLRSGVPETDAGEIQKYLEQIEEQKPEHAEVSIARDIKQAK